MIINSLEFIRKMNTPMVRSYLLRSLTYLVDSWLGDGSSWSPFFVNIQLTQRCNLRCKMCGQWGISGNFYTTPSKIRRDLEVEEWKKIIDDIARVKPGINLWGGEPLLYKDIIELITHIKNKGLPCYMFTNGMLLEKYAEDLVRLALDGITISIDGPKDVHDEIRGVKGSFDYAKRGIKLLKSLRGQEAKKLYIGISSVISEYNYEHIREIIEVADEVGVDAVTLMLTSFITSKMGEEYQEEMKMVFGCDAYTWKGWVNDEMIINPQVIIDALSVYEISNIGRTPVINLEPNIQVQEISNYFLKPRMSPRYNRCFQSYFEANILPNGEVHFCNEFHDYILGNLVEEDFESIWNNERAREFRRYVNSRLFSICRKCCRLYIYPFSRYIPRKLVP